MMMKLKLFFLLSLCGFGCQRAMAQELHYTPVAAGTYPNTMSIAAVVMDGETQLTDVELAAFAGDECRGAIRANDKGVYWLNVRGAGSVALVFKVWDGSEETVVDQGVAFVADAILGSPDEPYVVQLGENVPAVALDENAVENTFAAQERANVGLARTLSSDYWNTLCVPFDIPAATLEAVFGAGTQVMEMTEATESFVRFTTVAGVTAGVPCLLLPAQTVANPEFEGVSVIAPEAELVCGDAAWPYLFVGTYCSHVMKTNRTEIFIQKDNTLAYPFIGGNRLKGMRAFIRRNANAGSSEVKLTTLLMGDEATAIEAIEGIDGATAMSDGRVYSLTGQYVGRSAASLPRGIYIVNGRKTVVK